LSYASANEIQFKSSCDDTHISYDIPVAANQANVLRLRAGTCTEAEFQGEYDRDTEILKLKVPFKECQLKMYSDTELYVRSSQKYFSSTIEITFGVVDADMGNIEIIYHTTALAVQCQIPTDYEVTFDYTVTDRTCNKGEKLINGICVWWGQLGANFEIHEYTDSTYTTIATTEAGNKVTTSGEVVHLGITASDVPNDFHWGVENCWIIETETDENNAENTHLLIDPAGTASVGAAQTCTRDTLQLSAFYNVDMLAAPQFRMQHMLFMLNSNDRSEFKLKCNIKLCCIGDDGTDGTCEATSENEICQASKDKCGSA